MTVRDEQLSAYLDGELPADEAAAVAAAIAASPELEARLARLREADRLAARGLHAIDDRPLPVAVRDLLARDDAPRRPRAWASSPLARPLALAASIALLIGFGAGLLTALPFAVHTPASAIAAANLGEIAPGQPLFPVLETTPSGTRRALAGLDLEATPTLSFRAKDGRYCRELVVAGRDLARQGLFCRMRTGAWQALAMVAAPGPDESAYAPAADESTALLDRTMAALIDGAPLDTAAERRRIAGGWRAPDS